VDRPLSLLTELQPRGIGRQDRLLLLFALANAGGVVAYAPLLTLLLPGRIMGVAGPAHIQWVGATVLAGAVAASVSNILWGWLSDVAGTRRRWATVGLCLTVASYVPLFLATSLPAIIAAVCLYQFMLNMLLAPLAAWMAQGVPDDRKGRLGGWLGAGPLVGALAGVAATFHGATNAWLPLAVVCVLVVAFTAPLLVLQPATANPPMAVRVTPPEARFGGDLVALWIARLLVQVAGGTLFGFLLLYFHALATAPADGQVAQLSAGALLLAFPIAYVFGAKSDRIGRRKPFLVVTAAVAAAGLMIMGQATAFMLCAFGYLLFAVGSNVFLALHSGYAMQLLPSPARCGRDLGLINLSNTLPSIVAPVLALWLVPAHGFSLLLTILSALLLLAGLIVLLVRRDDAGSGDGRQRSAVDAVDQLAGAAVPRQTIPAVWPERQHSYQPRIRANDRLVRERK